MKRTMLFLTLILLTSGCSLAEPLIGASKDVSKLRYYRELNVDHMIFKANLSVVEKITVQNAINNLESSRALIKWYKDHPTEILKGKDDYNALKKSYQDLRQIVINHKAEYDSTDLKVLKGVDTLVRSLDQNLKDSINVLEDNERLVKAYKVVTLLIKLTKIM